MIDEQTKNFSDIRIAGTIAQIDGPGGGVIAEMLSYPRHRFGSSSATGLQVSTRRESMFVHQEDGSYVFPAGLVDSVVEMLRADDVMVHVTGDNAGADLPHHQDLPQSASDADRLFLQAVIDHRRGQIAIRTESERCQLIAQICRLYPTAKVLIVAPTRKAVGELYDKVGYPLAYNIGRTTGRSQLDELRYPRLVATYQSGCLGPRSQFDIVVHAHAETLAGKRMMEGAMSVSAQRVYGFVTADQQHSDRTRLVVEGVCGPQIFEVAHPHGPQAQVGVVAVEAPWVSQPPSDSARERFDQGIRQNEQRNRLVADLAQTLADQNATRLLVTGVPYSAHLDQLMQRDEHPSVVVVAEDPTHGRQLRRWLHQWPLWTQEAGRQEHRHTVDDQPANCIVTLLALHKIHQFNWDVIVWACGCSSLVDVPCFPPRCKDSTPRQIVAVDIVDDFDVRAGRDAHDRLSQYASAGWSVESAVSNVTRTSHLDSHSSGNKTRRSPR